MDDVTIITSLETVKQQLDRLKGAAGYDARGLSLAITYLETAMLWFANARPEEEV